MAQVWLFIVAPLIGAGIAGVLFQARRGAVRRHCVTADRSR
jgi:hypothetical protein